MAMFDIDSEYTYLTRFGEEIMLKAQENHITQDIFQHMSNEDMASLTPSLGQQIRLRLMRDEMRTENLQQSTSTLSSLPRCATPTSTATTEPLSTSTPSSAELSSNSLELKRSYFGQPSFNDIEVFIKTLQLHPKALLSSKFNQADIAKLQESTSIDHQTRRKIQLSYCRFVLSEWTNRFPNNYYVDVDVQCHLASVLVETFPGLKDESSTGHATLFTRQPRSGYIYDCFKNIIRGLPNDLKKRKKSRKSETTAAAATTVGLDELTAEDGQSYDDKVEAIQNASTEAERKDLYSATYRERREWIVGAKSGPSIDEILAKFPFWKHTEQVAEEFCRICPSVDLAAIKRLEDILGNVSSANEPAKQLEGLIKALHLKNRTICPAVIVSSSIPGVLPAEATTSPGPIYLAYTPGDCNTLYVVVIDKYYKVDSLAQGLLDFIRLHYIFNIHYLKIITRLCNFLEHVLGLPGIKISASMKALLR